MQIISEMLENTMKAYPEQIAVIFRDERFTYNELLEHIYRLSNGFARLGIVKGDWVMEFIPNSPQLVFTHFALITLGAVVVPLNVMYKHHEIEYVGKTTKAKAIVADSNLWAPLAEEVMQSLPTLQTAISIGEHIPGTISFIDLMEETELQAPSMTSSLDDIVSVIFTSRTTGARGTSWRARRNCWMQWTWMRGSTRSNQRCRAGSSWRSTRAIRAAWCRL